MESLIKTENLTFSYAGTDGVAAPPVLKNVNIEIEKGTFTAIIGHNGSGKTTLAKHFNAILLPGGGRVYACGMDTENEELMIEIRRRIGMVFQNPDNQIVATVVEEDVAFAPENLGFPSDEIRERVDDALRVVDMYDYAAHAPHLLSGGQKQRIAIAGVLAMNPECIVFDEPTAMLDPLGRDSILIIMRELPDIYGITVVLITHNMDEAASADRIVVMSDGQIIKDGTPRQVFGDIDTLHQTKLDVPETVQLLHVLKNEGFGVPVDALSVDECSDAIVKACSGVSPGAAEPPRITATAEMSEKSNPLLEIKKLTHTYSIGTPFERTAICDIDFSVSAGEYLGIIGATGSGKSTLISHLNGLLRPTSGSILYGGADIYQSKQHTRDIRFKVGLVFQYPEYQLFEATVFDDIAFGPKNMGLSQDEIAERVRESAEFVGLDESILEKSPFELSGGQKRRVAIAGVIAMRPEILILDEPTAGLDPGGQTEIIRNISEYKAAHNATIILVTHDMDIIAKNVEKLIVLSHGKIAVSGAPADVFSQTEKLAELGLAAPKASMISANLRMRGVPVADGVYTIEQLQSSLISLRKGGSGCA